jgi:HAD superfamily hydrolase (TIGR01490 family)
MPLAFFDMDYTLLSKSTSVLYLKYLLRRRMVSLRELVDVSIVSLQYKLNVLDFPKATASLSRSVRGGDAEASRHLCQQFVQDDVLQHIAPKAVDRLREHQSNGDSVLLLSASTQYVVQPVAQHLGIACRFTELEIGQDGKFTGGIIGPAAYADGKRYWGERIAREHGVPLSDCWFYTDSYSDHPLMDVVGHPVAINPDRKLKNYAQEKGWPVEYFY